MSTGYLRDLGAELSEAELSAANDVLSRHGLRTHTDKARLLDVLMAVSECSTDTFVALAAEVRAAIDGVEASHAE